MSMFPVINKQNFEDFLDFEDFVVQQGNILKKTDSYNLSHTKLKCNVDWEISHVYNRKRGMILYGFNKRIAELLSTQVTMPMVTSAYAHAIRKGMSFPYEMFKEIVEKHNGWIPIEIEALPDGRWCPKGTPFAQIRNTVEGFGELVTWFEGVILKMAFPSGCATRAYHMRKYLERKQVEQGQQMNPLFLFRFHSFGYRGYQTEESAYYGSTAWSMFLPGTDDFHASWYFYDTDMSSIPALAHKVTQQFDGLTREEAELAYGVSKAFKGDVHAMFHAIDQVAGEENIVALVIDTYDAFRVIHNNIIDLAMYARDKGVHIVFRPDSGDVLEQGIMIYWKLKNAGLEDAAHCIIGEGMSFEVAQRYDERLEQEGIPLAWFFYGIGGGFYKDIDRDWVGAAMKTAYSNGADRMKLVLTAPEKSSIPGAVQLVKIDGILTIVPEEVAIQLGMYSEYVKLYSYVPGMDRPRVLRDQLGAIRDRARNESSDQGRIAMSKEILDKIEGFRHLILDEEAV